MIGHRTAMSRELRRAAWRWADHTSQQISDTAGTRRIIATVTTVTPNGAADGTHPLVKITWRGSEVRASGFNASYTPTVGDRVVCDLVDSQLFVSYSIVGQP